MPISTDNWEVWEPQGGKHGKFLMYQNQIVVIVQGDVSADGKDISKGRMYLTEAVLKLLQNPQYIKLMTRAGNVGLMKVEEESGAYSVSKKTVKNATPFINCSSFIQRFNVKPGVYTAHLEGGVIIFDRFSTPSRI